MMDKAYCAKCGMEVDDLEKHNQEVHGGDNGESGGMNGGDMSGDEDM